MIKLKTKQKATEIANHYINTVKCDRPTDLVSQPPRTPDSDSELARRTAAKPDTPLDDGRVQRRDDFFGHRTFLSVAVGASKSTFEKFSLLGRFLGPLAWKRSTPGTRLLWSTYSKSRVPFPMVVSDFTSDDLEGSNLGSREMSTFDGLTVENG